MLEHAIRPRARVIPTHDRAVRKTTPGQSAIRAIATGRGFRVAEGTRGAGGAGGEEFAGLVDSCASSVAVCGVVVGVVVVVAESGRGMSRAAFAVHARDAVGAGIGHVEGEARTGVGGALVREAAGGSGAEVVEFAGGVEESGVGGAGGGGRWEGGVEGGGGRYAVEEAAATGSSASSGVMERRVGVIGRAWLGLRLHHAGHHVRLHLHHLHEEHLVLRVELVHGAGLLGLGGQGAVAVAATATAVEHALEPASGTAARGVGMASVDAGGAFDAAEGVGDIRGGGAVHVSVELAEEVAAAATAARGEGVGLAHGFGSAGSGGRCISMGRVITWGRMDIHSFHSRDDGRRISHRFVLPTAITLRRRILPNRAQPAHLSEQPLRERHHPRVILAYP